MKCRLCRLPIRFWHKRFIGNIPTKELKRSGVEKREMNYDVGVIEAWFHEHCATRFAKKMDWWLWGSR